MVNWVLCPGHLCRHTRCLPIVDPLPTIIPPREAGGEPISNDTIKACFRKAVMEVHPDRHARADEATRAAASEKFRRLQKAYETLIDPEQRRLYDHGQLVQ